LFSFPEWRIELQFFSLENRLFSKLQNSDSDSDPAVFILKT